MRLQILMMTSIVLGANFYVFLRIWQMMPPSVIGRILLIITAVVLASSFFLYFLIGSKAPVCLTVFIYKIGTAWFFILLYLLIIFLLTDILRLTPLPVNRIMNDNWLSMLVLAGLLIVIFGLGYINYRNKKRTELNIPVAKEMRVPLKVVAASDLHLGYGINRREFEQWVDLINNEDADIVLLAGDVIDTDVRPLNGERMYDAFKRIKSKYGVYAILGNHEYISDISKCLEFFGKTGVYVLRDSVALIDGMVYIAGRDDRTNTKRKTLEELTAGLDKTIPVILLDHQPYNLEKAQQNGVDVQISGHTHRGQIWPVTWITDRMYEKSYGLIKKGDANIYVSSGLGIWGGKFRIGSKSEYVVINLYSADYGR